MKRILLALLSCIAGASFAFGQTTHLKGFTTALPPHHMAPKKSAAARLAPVISVTPLIPNKSFDYTITASPALGGGVFTGTILGRNPLLRGKTTTTIPTPIIPLVITIDDGTTTVTYDPTAPDACIPGSPTDISVITASPVFQNTPWTINGVPIGTTQYVDAFQRAQFGLQGTGYHLVLNPSVLGGQTLHFTGAANGANIFVAGMCGSVGIVNINTLDTIVQGLITGPLAGLVNAGAFPLFFTKNVVESESGVSVAGCCVLGYHSGLFVGPNLQIYGLFAIDSTGVFPTGYTTTISHEIAEGINDPTVNNLTPQWGNIGQTVGLCQNNLEVGDPLSPGFGTPSNAFSVVGGNGLTYSMQEMAYYSWFFGTTGLGVGAGGSGAFSNNGTFHHTAVLCPPGTPTGGPF
ncbi:MAG TPA: hypothetical protein VGF07_06085 [Stellaceae bacterium]|jgi:hypothetical protein